MRLNHIRLQIRIVENNRMFLRKIVLIIIWICLYFTDQYVLI